MLLMLCRDCWSVAFGNSFNDEERCVLAGYDNGDVKLFDLRMNQVCACWTCPGTAVTRWLDCPINDVKLHAGADVVLAV
jgi:hypothetical protein